MSRWAIFAPVILLAGCVLAGAGRGQNGGKGTGGTAQVFFGPTQVVNSAEQKEQCKKELDGRAIPYTKEAFFDSVKQGDVAVVRLFLRCGMAIETTKYPPGPYVLPPPTALLYAAENGRDAVVRVLLDSSADITAKGALGGVLNTAIAGGCDPSTVQLLLRRGAKGNGDELARVIGGFDSTDFRTILKPRSAAIIAALLQAGARLGSGEKAGREALAYSSGGLDQCQQSVSHSSNGHAVGEPVCLKKYEGSLECHPDVSRVLLRAGVDPNPAEDKTQPLTVALNTARRSEPGEKADKCLEVACLLLQAGAKTDRKDAVVLLSSAAPAPALSKGKRGKKAHIRSSKKDAATPPEHATPAELMSNLGYQSVAAFTAERCANVAPAQTAPVTTTTGPRSKP